MSAASPNAAQDLSQFLETVKEKVDSYNAERKQLAESLREIVKQAQRLLSELGEPVSAGLSAVAPAGRRRGRPPGSGSKRHGPSRPLKAAGGRPKGRRKVSAETRKKMADAAKKRWAKKKGVASE